MGLPKCRHLPQDQVDQTAWIRREERIRYDQTKFGRLVVMYFVSILTSI